MTKFAAGRQFLGIPIFLFKKRCLLITILLYIRIYSGYFYRESLIYSSADMRPNQTAPTELS